MMKKYEGKEERIARLSNPNPGPSGTFSSDLLLTAHLMLQASLEDRKGNANPPLNNHMSKHVVGSIVLLISGFESWLNEALAHLANNYDSLLRLRGKDALLKKYQGLCGWDGTGHFPLANIETVAQMRSISFEQIIKDLALVIEVRHEIVHPMPLSTGTPWNIPENFLPLHRAGILISKGHPDDDYLFIDKLRSYALAYWCWEVVQSCVSLLVEHLKPDQYVAWTAPNFFAHKALCAPKDLSTY